MIGLDAARVLSTFGVVWVHTLEIQEQSVEAVTLGRFGTSFYTLGAVFLAARPHFFRPEVETWEIARKRAKRLLVPYLMWSGIYAAFYLATMLPQGYSLHEITRYWGPFFGTAPHLWFLPFAFVAGVAASFCVPRLMRWPSALLLGGGILSTLGLYLYVYGMAYGSLDKLWLSGHRLHRLARWVEEAPLVIGAIFGCALYGKHLSSISRWGRRKRTTIAHYCLLGFLLTQIGYAHYVDELGQIFWNQVRFLANVAGAFWLSAFLARRNGRLIERLAPLGAATYFAYLSHQLILDTCKGPLAQLPAHGTLWFAVLCSVVVFAVSVSLGLLVTRVPSLRWLSP